MELTKVWRFAAVALMLVGRASAAQTVAQHPVTDSEKIVDALSAGPPFITKHATILDWPSTPGGQYRVFARARTNGVASLLCPAIRMTSRDVSTKFLCSG